MKSAVYHYKIYGLLLASNRKIPYLISCESNDVADIAVEWHQSEFSTRQEVNLIYSSTGCNVDNIPYFNVSKSNVVNSSLVSIVVSESINSRTEFLLEEEGRNVKIYFSSSMSFQTIYAYLLGPVIGCIMRLKKMICLHASVVNINGFAIVFIGNKGAGKSTLIAKMASLGYSVLSDDIAPIIQRENAYYISPGYPCLRLWRNVITDFGIDTKNFEEVIPGMGKLFCPLNLELTHDKWKFQMEPLPLKAIYHLEELNDKNVLKISSVNLFDGMKLLLTNTYAEYLVEGKFSGDQLNTFSHLIRTGLQIKSIARPFDLNLLERSCALIIDDLQ